MDKTTGIAAAIGLILFLYVAQQAAASTAPTLPIDNNAGNPYMPSLDNKIAALLATIGRYESNGDYSIINGDNAGHYPITDFSHHPFEPGGQYYALKQSRLSAGYSTASGKYQFIVTTWIRLRDKLSLPDFSPDSQEKAAYELLQETGAFDALNNDDLETAFADASKEWDSMPGPKSHYPQPLATVIDTYTASLG